MDQLFLTINTWMGQGLLYGALGCFFWGVVSVMFSPCHMASIPLMVSYVAGQHHPVTGIKGVFYAIAFSTGLFITIAVVGVICGMLGRMLGDVGPYWSIAVGLLLFWVALDMLGVAKCSMSNGLLGKLTVKGLPGALVLGLAYGILSGSCTFGFIAPILAIISVQETMLTGLVFIVVFAIGHCLPIALAGSSTAMVKRLLENSSWHQGGRFFRKVAGTLIACLAVYFWASPFLSV
jgi:cytochrome c-type biogenesis protein